MKSMRRIETLLSWAYLEEIPKLFKDDGDWERLRQYGYLGGVGIDASNTYRAPDGDPHPDAKRIGQAVAAFGKVHIEDCIDVISGELLPLVKNLYTINDFRPHSNIQVRGSATIAGYYDEGGAPPVVRMRSEARRISTIDVTTLVIRHAKMGTRPEWIAGTPRPRPDIGARGAPRFVGACKAKNYYSQGSYCPLDWSPSPLHVILGRADYHLWHQALTKLSDTLELEHFEILPLDVSAAPWIEGERPFRVFSYHVGVLPMLPLYPQREAKGPPLSRWKPRREAANSL